MMYTLLSPLKHDRHVTAVHLYELSLQTPGVLRQSYYAGSSRVSTTAGIVQVDSAFWSMGCHQEARSLTCSKLCFKHSFCDRISSNSLRDGKQADLALKKRLVEVPPVAAIRDLVLPKRVKF
eukprot:6205849-Pleurochrysis_carterae.AAC.3